MTRPVEHNGPRSLVLWAWGLLRLDFTGIAIGTLFFCLSLTPSLLPRSWQFAGLIGGMNAALGYGLGVLLGKGLCRFVLRGRTWWPPSSRAQTALKVVTVGVAIAASVLMVVPAAGWQRQVSELMGIEGPGVLGYTRTLVVAAAVAIVLVAVARVLLDLTKLVARMLIRRWRLNGEVAQFIGTAVVVILLVTLINGVLLRGFLAGASRVFQPQNTATRDGVEQPSEPQKSGSPASFASWDSLGYQGRNFVAGGPDAAELTRINGAAAKEPIRVYVGLQTADTDEARLAVLLSELHRTDAFEREALVIVPTTGTGWVNPVAARAVELMYNGDTAIVALQYSYLPSWISFLGDQHTSMRSGQMLIGAVHDRWAKVPESQRPKLMLYGESLGSMAGQSAFGYLPDIALMGFDSVLWVGPPQASPLWRALIERRDPHTTEVAPRYDNGRTVRFSQGGDPAQVARDTAGPWDDTKVLFLQHASDPIVWWSPDLLLSRPDWLVEPRGQDRTAAMRWYPFVTFSQVGADMLNASEMPAGHGHNYDNVILDGWVAVAAPPDWTAADTERIRGAMEQTVGVDDSESSWTG
ncbi:alpha/beta hydrolase [[Mycobacterium] wendilense]|uniref:Alpha/beta hydrolase n=1 Tax=[Mycobacterium] wendilense TaxID=3064284 RepID=A0ABM9M9H5_9MYCO|nr:alpha/beta hydrolase [Mycolicibacterium sp. MU0050]CAJ1579668.1 alpha/beta hydrolase [Mycolicibacterium sp. MU0050]